MESSLKGKVALVTGGAQGIGKGIVMHLLDEGMKVLAADFDQEALDSLKDELSDASKSLLAVRCDVSDEASVDNLAQAALSAFGQIDAVVSNAGIGGPFGTKLEDLSLADWNRVIGINLTGCFLLARRFAAELRRSHGAIVNISSTRALMSEPDTEPYSASKGGILALTHALAVSLGPDVRVNCVSPGWIETCQFKKPSARREPAHSDADKAQHPCGRVGTPQDIASLVRFLISAEAGFITGQNFVCDGGMTRRMIYV